MRTINQEINVKLVVFFVRFHHKEGNSAIYRLVYPLGNTLARSNPFKPFLRQLEMVI